MASDERQGPYMVVNNDAVADPLGGVVYVGALAERPLRGTSVAALLNRAHHRAIAGERERVLRAIRKSIAASCPCPMGADEQCVFGRAALEGLAAEVGIDLEKP